ncbi:MAG: 3,4-dihydroxy-2-butanone-4-phosphate synthase [Bdellovibrionota bacterium]
MDLKFNTTAELISDIRQGKMVILVDDEDRENEGDLVLAADFVTSEAINFMALEARGLICLALSTTQIEKLKIPLMVREDMNLTPNKTAFTVSIEASEGISTGISAADRAHTIRVASHPDVKPSDIHTPGHVFPIRAQNGGVLRRAGHTEGSVDLANLAGLNCAAVICEVMNRDGTMARVKDLFTFAKTHNLKIGTIVDLIQYRLQHDTLVEMVDQFKPENHFGKDWTIKIFRSKVDQVEHIVFQKGELKSPIQTVRVQLDHYPKEFLWTLSDTDSPLKQSLKKIDEQGEGAVVLLRGNNRPHIASELRSIFSNNEDSPNHVHSSMDLRDYGVGAQILRALGMSQIRLITNKPEKRVGIKAYGLEIVDNIPLFEGEP